MLQQETHLRPTIGPGRVVSIMDIPQVPAREATPEQVLENVCFEIDQTQTDSAELGRKKLKAAASLAVTKLTHIMLYSDDERLKLKAATYIIDRVYGTGAQASPLHSTEQDAYDTLFEKIKETNS